jgi:hypothetical protein
MYRIQALFPSEHRYSLLELRVCLLRRYFPRVNAEEHDVIIEVWGEL